MSRAHQNARVRGIQTPGLHRFNFVGRFHHGKQGRWVIREPHRIPWSSSKPPGATRTPMSEMIYLNNPQLLTTGWVLVNVATPSDFGPSRSSSSTLPTLSIRRVQQPCAASLRQRSVPTTLSRIHTVANPQCQSRATGGIRTASPPAARITLGRSSAAGERRGHAPWPRTLLPVGLCFFPLIMIQSYSP